MRIASLAKLAALTLVSLLALWSAALAQQDDAAEKSGFIRYVEDTLSTPDRKISLGEIDGALSSDVRISSITIADRQGVWLRIEGVHLIWSRLALLSRRLDIDLLEAQSITIMRKPLPAEGFQPASSGFSLPELPVSIKLTKLVVPIVKIDASIAGQDTTVAVAGGGEFAEGALKAELAIERTQPAGGRLFFKTAYANTTRILDLDLSLREPKDGLLSNLFDLPGRPALAFRVVGSGPIDAYAADVALTADNETLLSGRTTIKQGAHGLDFAADLTGSLARLVPPAYGDFFTGTSSLTVATRRTADGGLAIDRARIVSGVLSVELSGALSADGFPTALAADGRLGARDGKRIALPGGAGASLTGARFSASLAEGGWRGRFDLDALNAGTVRAEHAIVTASGEADHLTDAANRHITFAVESRAEGLGSDDAAMARALGKRIELAARGSWQAGEPVKIGEIRVGNANLSASFVGRLDGDALDGSYRLSTPDLAALIGNDVRGKAQLKAEGSVALIGGAFALTIDGMASDLGVGIAAVDPLLAGETSLKGTVARDPGGLALRSVRLAGRSLDATLDGLYGAKTIALKAQARLPNVKVLSDRASGAATLVAELSGGSLAPGLEVDLEAPTLILSGKPFKDAHARFAGVLGERAGGELSLTGTLGGVAVAASTRISSAADNTLAFADIKAKAGRASLVGDLTLGPQGLANGALALDAPDVAAVAPLVLMRGSGSLFANIALAAENGRQNASVRATAKGLVLETVRLASAAIDAKAQDIFGVPSIQGKIDAEGVSIGSFVMGRLQAKAATTDGRSTQFNATAALQRGKAAMRGAIRPAAGGFDMTLESLDLEQDGIAASLAQAVTVASRAEGLMIPPAVLRIGQGGRVTVAGQVGKRLALKAEVAGLPASLANLASPDLGVSGTLSGRITVGGTPAEPTAEFSLHGETLSTKAWRVAGLTPLQVEANGRLAGKAVAIEASARGEGGLAVSAKGALPLSGAGLAISITGSAPLALANAALRERAARLTGTLSVDARITGALAAPRVDGQASIINGTFIDPDTGTQLSAIAGRLRFAGDRLSVEALSAKTPGAGTVSISGPVSLRDDFPLDLTIALRDARISDGTVVTAILSGDLSVRGPALRQPLVAGSIRVSRAEITIPERFARNAALLGIRHLAAPPEVLGTLARVRSAEGGQARRGQMSGVTLDIAIDAPARVFVRGRGLDAELGGQVRLSGPITSLSPVGAFRLRRGALNIIGQHITLDSGEVRLEGDLNPTIDFAATARSARLIVTARVTGQASDPQIVLSSVPELPQDEVLAHFLFGHSISDLSPFQVVQLATAVAQLAGGSGGDLLSSIRTSTGLDNLSITTDTRGNAALQAGRYISERIYLGVTTGVGGQTDATLNLDVTRNLKARAQAGTGGAGIGLFYEREY
jgi:translocation and assembly module TamB